jgi:putative ABC transport system permease protein
LQERLEALNGIERVGAVSWLPVSGEFNSWGFRLEGREGWVGANFRIIEGHYFDAFGIRLLEGRTFAHSDDAESPLVTVVNQALVERDFAGREAIGQMILAEDRAWEIIGVVENVAHDHKGAVVPKVYLSHAQFGDDRNWALTQVISATRPWRDVVAQTRRELAAVDPELTLHNVRTMHTVMAGDIAREMFALVLMSVFGTVAILLVTVGIYGVLMYAVNERTREIGIRLALGASIGAVRGAVVRHGLTLTIIGIVIGLAGAAGLTRLLRSMLYGVGTLDPIVLVTVPVVIAIVAALAGYVPARRATRVDPMEALRQE